jgi:hypothetical protein
MKSKFIIVRYFIKSIKRNAHYYSTNAAQNSHFWSFSDRNAKIFSSLQQARDAESMAYDEEFMTNIFEFDEAMRMPDDKNIQLFTDLLEKAQECGCKNYF